MKVIGITGGIGSGKSLVAGILEAEYGAYHLNTDKIARKQMEIGGISYQAVLSYFGDRILAEDNSIDRTMLAGIIFQDEENRKKINELTHNNVLIEVQGVIKNLKAGDATPYIVVETALMIEAGFDYICDEVWYVHTDETKRRQRLKRERNYSDEKIDAIFKSQSKEEAFFEKFSIVIYNDGDMTYLKEQIELLMHQE